MRPDARVLSAIEIVGTWLASADGMDRVLARWARENRFAGSGDRHAIADLVYDAVRRMRSAGWVAGVEGTPSAREILLGSMLLDSRDPASVFSGAKYAPEEMRAGEIERARPLDCAPPAIGLDLPDWLYPAFAEYPDAVALALRERAPLDLRVNLLKGGRAAAAESLAADGIEAAPTGLSDTALRVHEGARKVARASAYLTGLVEIQDAASQAVVDMIDISPGATVLDLCAGAGGKTLALAARMSGDGRFLVHDIAQRRMEALAPRAERAGVVVEVVETDALQDLARTCDLVLVDAPCSGSGAWRRNPDAKWRLTADTLAELQETQAALLQQAAELASEGGRIAYMTCSLLACENRERVDMFVQQSPDWQRLNERQFTPLDGGDGFFCSILSQS